MLLNSKHPETSFSPTSTESLYLQVAQMPRSQDLVIFVDDNDNNNNDTSDYFTPCACAQGNYVGCTYG